MNDETCVQRCREGHSEAFRLLVERYQRSVFGLLFLRLRNRTLAEEGAQESFVRAYENLARLRDPAGFHAWLLGIAAKVALELRREGLRLDSPESLPEPEASIQDPLDRLALQAALNDLPEGMRQMVLLRFFEDYTCAEIAAHLGMPLGSVTKTLSRAYAQLRLSLTPQTLASLEHDHELS